MCEQAVKQKALIMGMMLTVFIGLAGCGRVVPQVYSGHLAITAKDMSVTTRYPDGSTESLRGKGELKGMIRTSDIYSGSRILVLFVRKQNGNEYRVEIPGWQGDINPFEADWWVVVDYSFSESSEWLRVMAQGHGQIFMYYAGSAAPDKTADPIIQCRLRDRLFWTSDYETMACKKVLAHYSVTCKKGGYSWQLAPGTVIVLNDRSMILNAGTRVLRLVDAFRVKKGCQGQTGSRMTYYWFKLPHKTAKNKVVTKNDE